LLEQLLEEFIKNKGKVLGVLLGLIFGWFTIQYGFLKTLFIFFAVSVGYIIGKRVDEQVGFRDMLSRVFGPKN